MIMILQLVNAGFSAKSGMVLLSDLRLNGRISRFRCPKLQIYKLGCSGTAEYIEGVTWDFSHTTYPNTEIELPSFPTSGP